MAWGVNGGKKAEEAGTRALVAADQALAAKAQVQAMIPIITSSNEISNAAKAESAQANTIAKQADKQSKEAITIAQNIIANAGNSNTEIVDGRLRDDGTAAPTIGEHIREVSSELHRRMNGITSIQLSHGLNDFPSVHVVIVDGFGINAFGFGAFGGGDRYNSPCRVEYLDSSSLLLFIPEGFSGTPSIKIVGNLYTVTFPNTDAFVEIYLRGNH